jgi:hypothetical protein
MTLAGYDEDGRAELDFDESFTPRTDDYSHTHSNWVEREFIALVPAVRAVRLSPMSVLRAEQVRLAGSTPGSAAAARNAGGG